MAASQDTGSSMARFPLLFLSPTRMLAWEDDPIVCILQTIAKGKAPFGLLDVSSRTLICPLTAPPSGRDGVFWLQVVIPLAHCTGHTAGQCLFRCPAVPPTTQVRKGISLVDPPGFTAPS